MSEPTGVYIDAPLLVTCSRCRGEGKVAVTPLLAMVCLECQGHGKVEKLVPAKVVRK